MQDPTTTVGQIADQAERWHAIRSWMQTGFSLHEFYREGWGANAFIDAFIERRPEIDRDRYHSLMALAERQLMGDEVDWETELADWPLPVTPVE